MNKKLLLIGKNISHSKSPELYNSYFKEHNLDYTYELCEIDDLKVFIDKLKNDKNNDIYAFNVTMPYKIEIMKYLDKKDLTCEKAESCNLVIIDKGKLIGFNTDGIGFFEALKKGGVDPEEFNLCIIGDGGAAKAIKAAAKNYKINEIYTITHKISDNLFSHNNLFLERIVAKHLKESEIIVNASNVGFNGDKNMPLPKKMIDDLLKFKLDFCFVDIIYNPLETPMLRYMREKEVFDTFNGEPMLYEQFLANIRFLFEETNTNNKVIDTSIN